MAFIYPFLNPLMPSFFGKNACDGGEQEVGPVVGRQWQEPVESDQSIREARRTAGRGEGRHRGSQDQAGGAHRLPGAGAPIPQGKGQANEGFIQRDK